MAFVRRRSDCSVTLESIAQAAGVSRMTVSRALRGDRNHSEEMRRRIRELAENMGYRPNPLVSALMRERALRSLKPATANLALLNMSGSRDTDPDGYTAGAFDQAEKQGYAIEEYLLSPTMVPKRLRRILLNRGVRGIVLRPAPYAPFHLDFDFEDFATVAIGFSVPHQRLHRVASDAFMRILDAVKHLDDRGYRRIGLVNCSDLEFRFNFAMTAGAQVVRRAISPHLVLREFFLEAGTQSTAFNAPLRSKIKTWIRRNRIEVVMSQQHYLFQALIEEGLRIPQDIAYLHLNRSPDIPSHTTCMDQMVYLTGQTAVEQVTAMINRNDVSLPTYPTVVIVPSIWREGKTVPWKGNVNA